MPTLNRQNLEDEFNMTENDVIEPEIVDDDEPEPFVLEWDNDTSNANTIRKNIERANTILDRISEELDAGNFSARLVEVAGQIINSITTASKVLIDDTNYNKYIDIRKSLALLKKREVDIKELKGGRPRNQNLIVASREDVLKILREPDKRLENKFNSE